MQSEADISKKHKAFSLAGQHKSYTGKHVLFTETPNIQDVVTCKKRMHIAIGVFTIIYFCIILKIFNACLSDGIVISGFEEITKEKKIIAPVSRADIIDRNGTLIATSLPTVNLQVSPKYKIKNPEEVAQKLSVIFPELKYEHILKNLKKTRKKRKKFEKRYCKTNNYMI